MAKRREFLAGVAAGAAISVAAISTVAVGAPAGTPVFPWLKRAFQLYTASDGQSAIRQIELPQAASDKTKAQPSLYLLRRPAERVTMGSMPAGYMMDFHIANQPNILIPLSGALIVKLKNGSQWTFQHGDILFAEDCTGGGHMSGAGPEGCFSISIQLPKTTHCLDAKAEPSDIFEGRGKPAF